jgi:BR serine/threonine kinase
MDSEPRKVDRVGPYIFQRVLGSGTTGKVKLAVHSETNTPVAIKIVAKSTFEQKPGLQMKVRREIALMKIVNHPNILRLIDVFESPNHLFIVLEYAEHGELFDYLVARGSLAEAEALDFLRQITFGLEYLHSHGICHRDLKPENILLDSKNRVKIADFGFARWVRRDIAETSCGSPHYAAPEVIRGIQYDGRKADIWSLGVILYALLAGYLPFDDPSIRNVLHQVRRGVFEMPPVRNEVAVLIKQMLTVDPGQRPTIEEIKKSACFAGGMNPRYQMPAPIPFTRYATPIRPESLTDDVVLVLKQIGYGDEEELHRDLQLRTVSMAKVFVAMLTAQLDLDELPWEENGTDGSDSLLVAASFMASPLPVDAAPDPRDPFHRRVRNEQPVSPTVSSIALHSEWCVEPPTTIAEWATDDRITLTKVSIWDAMYSVQQAVEDCGLQFFHPDPVTIYVRKNDRKFYVSVRATFLTQTDIEITIRMHKGAVEQFEDFRDRVWQVLRGENSDLNL